MEQIKPAKWFESWKGPREFYRAADKGLEEFYQTGRAPPQYLREAYVAGAFARIWEDDQG